MDRYNDVKILLKNWEQTFVQEHKRKPNKEDIDRAPEQTRGLYKEYRSLKINKENSSRGHATQPEPQSQNQTETHNQPRNQSETQAQTQPLTEPQPALERETDIWGSHLNRQSQPVAAPSLTPQDRQSLQASAQYYGMKLKSNLGALTKERPMSLRKCLTPGRTPGRSPGPCLTPLKSQKHNHDQGSHSPEVTLCLTPSLWAKTRSDPSLPKPANTCPLSPTPPQQPEEPSEPLPAFQSHSPAPTPAPTTAPPSPEGWGERAGPRGVRPPLVRPSLTHRLSAVDHGWLQRCQVFGEVEEGERPVVGNLNLPCSTQASGPTVSAPSSTQTGGPTVSAPGSTQAGGSTGSALSSTQSGGPTVLASGSIQASGAAGCIQRVGGAADGAGLQDEDWAGPGGLEGLIRNTSSGKTHADDRKPRASSRTTQRQGEGGEEGGEGAGVLKPDPEDSGQDRKDGKKKGRKRRRNSEEEGENVREEEEEGKKKKRRRTRKTEASPGGGAKPKTQRKKKSQTGDHGSEEDGTVKVEPKVPPRDPQENLLGEVDEEDVKAARSRASQPIKPRAAQNSEGNFVRINLKKKSHVKGYALRGAALRKQMYVQKFQLKGERFGGGTGRGRGRFGGFSRQGDSCYKCGGTGHWARDCRGPAPPPATAAVTEEPVEEEPFELPTLEDVARATGTLRSESLAPPSVREEQQGGEEEVLLDVIRPDYERPPPPPPMEPLYSLGGDGKVQAAPDEVYKALKTFGYQDFRPGQESAIMRILSGLSTLVVLSTGMGKSLCYQLPAFLYAQRFSCITLVISPLVSLMDDQLSGLPGNLKAACIHSNMSQKQREAAIEKVKAGLVHVLLLSPEALVGGGHSGSGCLPPADQLPPVAFACIDEAHCVSEWSHNFRPCYLRLCKVLRDRLGVRCLLGLTATATLSTALDIARHLNISDEDGIAIRSAAVPSNLQLSVSTDRDKDQALVCLLKGERFGALDSIIVYCTRREETSRISALLRTCLQGVLLKETAKSSSQEDNPVEKKKKALARKKIRKPLKWMAESYHAGMSAGERRRVQNNFMCGELRVVVATVAFGMGLDKSDVRGIVHYNMPKSFESYVQEIGRAGRDGQPAHCHLFLDPEGGDLHELRRHIYSDTVDHYSLKRLVQKIFPSCKCRQICRKQQEITADEVEDSELLEMMDMCDQAGGPEEHLPAGQVVQSSQQAVDSSGTAHLPPQEVQSWEDTEDDQLKKQEVQRAEGDGDRSKVDEEQPYREHDWPCSRVCHTHERAIPMQETVEALDVTEEGLETLLCYLELHQQQWVELLHPTLSSCRLVCYGGPAQLRSLTKICPPVAVVLARKRMAGERVEVCDSLEFDVVELADTMGWQLPLVKRGLRQLQWSTDKGSGRSGVLVEFSKLSFYFRTYGDLSPEEMDRVCEFLQGRVLAQERTQLYQLSACFKAFRSVAYRSVSSCMEELEERRSLRLKSLLGDYFDKRRGMDRISTHPAEDEEEDELSKYKLQDWEQQIRADICSFLANRSDEKFSGRAVARIFHGIGSPCYPAQVYGRDRRFWRKYIQFDFNQLIRLATQEIIRFK